ncbi:hypothetical protein G9P44_000042 [Scheffersomyces stipitis]|nr:hypothetical protein G9P44_000042 [Scheffersomyces stipitis]
MTRERKLLIGIDVGGTNTDSVLLDPSLVSDTTTRGIIAWNKANTTSDVSDGIEAALTELFTLAPKVYKEDVGAVTIGTTHFLNAVIEQDRGKLDKVAVLRFVGPYSQKTEPFCEFPAGLKDILKGYVAYLDGGHYVHGEEVSELNKKEIHDHCMKIKELNIHAVVLVAQFSPLKNEHENIAEGIIKEVLPDIQIVKSYEIAGIGFLERENAAILNAGILRFANKVIASFNAAVRRVGLNCPVMLTQNDGTVLPSSAARKCPINTFSSGATNSMRGASILCSGDESIKGQSVLVVDVGGTTTDIGVLLPTGFPRQSASFSYVGGVRMNFSMPQVHSFGLGGGSKVRFNKKITIGPDSVGNEIRKQAIIFGGDTLTASDMAVGIGKQAGLEPELFNIGDPQKLDGKLNEKHMKEFQDEVKYLLEKHIDRMRTSAEPVPVLVVGGGSFIVPSDIEGSSKVLRPPYHGVANAIGAAMSKISGRKHLIKVVPNEKEAKENALQECIEEAKDNAVVKGAIRDSLTIVELSHDPIPYIPNTYEFIVKVVGDADHSRVPEVNLEKSFDDISGGSVLKEVTTPVEEFTIENVDIEKYKPKIENREWIISEIDLEFLKIGTYILGCGGGGTPHPTFIDIRNMLRNGATIRVIDIDDVSKYTDGERSIICVGFAGSPTVASEMLKADELLEAAKSLIQFTGQEAKVVCPLEIGGGNGFTGFEVGASNKLNIPVVDSDFMGRAYPTLWQSSANAIYEKFPYWPAAVSNGNSSSMLISEASNCESLERLIRSTCVEVGTHVGVVMAPMTSEELTGGTVPGSISLAWRIGRAVILARQKLEHDLIPQRIIESVGGKSSGSHLFTGKIVDVSRKVHKGHVYGEVIIEEPETKKQMVIPFKNENILCRVRETAEEEGKVVCAVPDLIAVLESETGEALGTPDYKYGLIVNVIAISPSNIWTDTEKAMAIGGPASFGFDEVEYVPVGTYTRPVSVIEEYC